jgi:acetolactate synthase-1/2/3 large subunit
VLSNRSYAILNMELGRVGATPPGPRALSMLDLSRPTLDFVSIARGMGVNAARAQTADDFNRLFQAAMSERGPHLIEAVL